MSLNPTSLLFLLLACPALMTLEATTSRPIEPRGQRSPRDTSNKEEPGSIKVVISEGCVTQGNSPGSEQGAKEVDLSAGSPLVLTHRITLVPSGSGAGAASSCGGGCEAQFAALRARLERLEKEVSELREKCGGEGGGCCNHQQSTGAGCTVRPEPPQCPNECSDQGRCVNGKCVCFPEFSGADCSQSNCPGDCKDQGKCVDGKCVCDPGFTGPDCSEQSCPDNCKNRGRCVNGKCVCNTGFTGPDCSEQTCPNNCKNRGQCVDGKCVCNTGFTGLDCSEQTCPDNCSGHGKCVNGKCVCDNGFIGPDCSDNRCSGNCRGRCVGGQCVCDPGFTGPDCTDKACPDSCSNQGKCVDGKCVCDVGFTGADCSAKGCPGNCNNKGRCVKGKCVCRRGFTGPDCGQCEVGLTGPDCSIVMSGVSRLSTRDITETSATLFWTPPSVQYDTYHITFTSKKEGDQQITSQTEGRQSSYNQTGLAAGLEYTATIRGEKEGRMGAESSTKFMTLISGPKNLQVVKTTTTSAVVQWGQSQGEIDRYRLTVSPNDGNGKERDMTLPADRDSAQIDQLEAGRLYDITLVAEKGKGKSKPAATQATPGVTKPRVTTETLATRRVAAPRRGEVGNVKRDPSSVSEPTANGPDQSSERRQGSQGGSVGGRASSSSREEDLAVLARATKPHDHTKEEEGGKRGLPRPDDRSILPRRPGLVPGPFRFNRTRIRPTGVRVGPGPLKKPTGQNPVVGPRERVRPLTDAAEGTKAASMDDRKLALTVKDSSVDTTSSDRGDTVHRTVMSPADPGSHNLRDSAKDTEGLKHPSGNEQQNTSSETGLPQENLESTTSSNETADNRNGKKCAAKIEVTHIKIGRTLVGGRLSPTGHGEGNTTDTGTHSVEENSPRPSHGLDLSPVSRSPSSLSEPDTVSPETNHYESEDILDQLLKETGLKIQTFSVHLTKPSHITPDADTTREQSSSSELAPLHPSSSSSSSQSSSSSSHSVSELPSPSPAVASKSSTNSALPSSSSKTIPSSSSDVLPSSSSSSSSVENFGPDDTSREGDMRTDSELGTKLNRTETLREGGPPPFRRPVPREGFLHRPRPNIGGPFQNRTRGYPRPPQHPQRGGPIRQPFPYRRTNGTLSPHGVLTSQSGEERLNGPAHRIQTSQSGEEGVHRPAHAIQTSQSGEKAIHIPADRITTSQSGEEEFSDPSHRIKTSQSGEEGMHSTSLGMETKQSLEQKIRDTDVGTNRERVNHINEVSVGRGNGSLTHVKPKGNQQSSSHLAYPVSNPNAPLKRKPSTTASGSTLSPGSVLIRNSSRLGRRRFPERNPQRSRVVSVKDISAPGETGEPLDNVGVQSLSSHSFNLVWSAPEDKYDNFVVTREQIEGEEEEGDPTGGKEEGGEGNEEKQVEGKEMEGVNNNRNKQEKKENVVPESQDLHPGSEGNKTTTAEPGTGSADRTFVKVLPGSSRSFPFQNLFPQSQFSVTLLGKGRGLLSKVHKLVISTGTQGNTEALKHNTISY